jgi:hypothetical protein
LRAAAFGPGCSFSSFVKRHIAHGSRRATAARVGLASNRPFPPPSSACSKCAPAPRRALPAEAIVCFISQALGPPQNQVRRFSRLMDRPRYVCRPSCPAPLAPPRMSCTACPPTHAVRYESIHAKYHAHSVHETNGYASLGGRCVRACRPCCTGGGGALYTTLNT